ncbi:hypothetical protein CNMCM8927_008511 [Aspergillus lentulus]|uniref:Uncharacterized protein n=1 Tax=Aspergillus lentulus TaxID=293939 RepID=A0AAN5YLD3_ASPLE|nr:hypothetical protein CNMCM8060_002269 [Aspergillus lentulus]KAF4199616.1 hypothetical protein CNMCM8694_003365 [Aspergillus lentulus]KAF4203653.1 hypothetical protein CNMCM8927_008511 [Aspergillus lentulus]
MPRPVVMYNNDLSRLLRRLRLTRRPSLASTNGVSVGQAMLLRTLLITLHSVPSNLPRRPETYARLRSPTPRRTLQILAIIDQLKRRIHEANTIALFAAFGLPYNANMTHLAALDMISLETYHDGGKCALLMNSLRIQPVACVVCATAADLLDAVTNSQGIQL